MDKSLRTAGVLSKHNNVLSRADRIARLQDEGRWQTDQTPFGLPKVGHRKAKIGGKTKKKEETAAPGAVGAPAVAAVTPAAGATAEKGAKATKAAKTDKGEKKKK